MKTRFSRTAEWQVLLLGACIISFLVYLASTAEDLAKDYTSNVEQVNATQDMLKSISKISGYVHQIGHHEKMFILTGKLKHLEPWTSAQTGLKSEIEILKQNLERWRFNLEQVENVENFINKRSLVSRRIIREREDNGRIYALNLLFEEKDQKLDAQIFKNLEGLNKDVTNTLNVLTDRQAISSNESEGLSRRFFYFSIAAAVLLMIGILHNLRQRKKMEVEIEASSDHKSQFLANMSHEIRTPLNAIIGMSTVLADSGLQREQKKYIDTIQKAGDALLTLINDILDLSKVESGNMKFESISFDLKKLIYDTIEIVEPRAQAKGLHIECRYSKFNPACLIGDQHRLQQVLLNLLSNAVKFTEKGKVKVLVRYKKEQLILSVRDTGIGISQENLKNIFQEFHQAEDASTTRKFGGTGLGLSISHKLSYLMGGKLSVVSELGNGSMFTLRINLKEDVIRTSAVTNLVQTNLVELSPEKMSSYENKTILIVDDSVDNRDLLHLYLSEKKCRILSAENGRQAVEIVQKEKVDLILMDMQMPVLSGYDATKEIRRFESLQKREAATIVALTAAAMCEERERTKHAGCTDFLSKPILKKVLLNKLDEYMIYSKAS